MANDLSIQSGAIALGTTMAGRTELLFIAAEQIAPDITNISPTSGQAILRNDAIQFDVTASDGSGIANTVIWVEYPDKQFTEVVWNGSSFSYNFSGTRTSITDGYRFRFQRLGGYSSSPIVQVQATAISGGSN